MHPLLPTLVLGLLVLGALVASAVLRANGGQHAWHPGAALTVEALTQRLAAEGGRHRLTVVAERQGAEDPGPRTGYYPLLTGQPIAA